MNGYSDEGGGIHPRKFYRALHMKVMENMWSKLMKTVYKEFRTANYIQ